MENEKYLKSLLKRYDAEIKSIKTATTTSEISVHERRIMPLMNEMQLALPRLGNDAHDEAVKRRKELNSGR